MKTGSYIDRVKQADSMMLISFLWKNKKKEAKINEESLK